LSYIRVEVDSSIKLLEAPASFVRFCKKELTFDNPDYKSAIQHGRRTNGIPRKIRPYIERNGNLSLPRGFWNVLVAKAHQSGLDIKCTDNTVVFPQTAPPKSILLRDYQSPWLESLLLDTQGVGVAPPGSGKTIMGLETYARLGQPCLWITHTGRLLRQARKRAEEFLGIETGIIGKGKEEIAHFTVGTVQTLVRKDLTKYQDLFGLIIIDECHHVPSKTFLEVVSMFNARYRYGLTATPYREDQLENLMFHTLGPATAYLDKATLRAEGKLMTPQVIRRPTKFYFPYNPGGGKKFNYQALTDSIITDRERNNLIATDVIVESSYDPDNVCIVLVGRIAHGEALYDLLKEVLPGVGLVHSKMSAKVSDQVLDDFESGRIRVLVATYRMLAEGFDYQPTNRLFLTAPYKGRALIEQACGRIERTFPGKTDAIIYDYVDFLVGVLKRQSEARLDVYEANNTPVTTLD